MVTINRQIRGMVADRPIDAMVVQGQIQPVNIPRKSFHGLGVLDKIAAILDGSPPHDVPIGDMADYIKGSM